jgi:cholesterol transport system auxiliary component
VRTCLALALCLTIGGCGGLTREAPAPISYRLTAPEIAAGEPLPADLLVAVPTAAPGLEGERIAASYPDRRLDYYAGARWGAELPAVVQSLLVESFRGSGRLRAVQGASAPFRVSHVLQVEVVRFEARYSGSGAPTVNVTLAATLGRRQGGVVLGSFTASAEVPATADRLGAIAAAFDAAWGSAATELVARTLDAVEADLASQRPATR